MLSPAQARAAASKRLARLAPPSPGMLAYRLGNRAVGAQRAAQFAVAGAQVLAQQG